MVFSEGGRLLTQNFLFFLFSKFFGVNLREGNGTPLQCSCLENPMDGGAW